MLIALLLSLPLLASAQPERYEKKANEILAEASKDLLAHDAMKMTFSYRIESEHHEQDDTVGGYMLTKGDKYYLKLGKHHFISDGTTVWSFLEEVMEVHISLAETTDQAISPASILENFRDEYTSKWIRMEPYGNDMVHIIDMVPVQPQTFFKIRLAIQDQTNEIVFSEAHDRQGATYRYDIDTIDTDPEIPENTFVFDPEDYPEELEIVDLR